MLPNVDRLCLIAVCSWTDPYFSVKLFRWVINILNLLLSPKKKKKNLLSFPLLTCTDYTVTQTKKKKANIAYLLTSLCNDNIATEVAKFKLEAVKVLIWDIIV